MIITIIADIYGEENNGTIATTNRLIHHMIKRGHTIRFVSSYKGQDNENISYYVVPKRSFYFLDNYISKNGATFGKPVENIIERAIIGSDVVHILIPFKMGKAAVKLAIKNGVAYTSAFHTQPENITTHIKLRDVQFANDLFYKRFYKQFYKYQQFIHCPSNFIKSEITKKGYTGDMKVISNGVTENFKKLKSQKPEELKDKFVIFTSSRYSSEKRHDLVIGAMKYSKYADRIQLVFAGKGPLKNKLAKLGKDLTNPVKFVFYNSKDDLATAFNYADLYVHPADIEIEAIACMEAASCGLVPVVSDSSRSATKQFAMTDKNLFKQGDAQDLAKKIDYWIEHPQEKEKMSEQYPVFMEKYQIEQAMDKMEEMFYEAKEWFKSNKQAINKQIK